MNEMLELHEFFVEGGDQRLSHVLLHITEPSTPEEFEKGYFFALSEIKNGNADSIRKIQKLIDDIELIYYETKDTKNKHAFETTLEKINRRGHHLLKKGDDLHCVIGVVRDRDLAFAYHGEPEAILFYHNKQGDLNHVDALQGESNDHAKEQLFSALIEGKINPDDYFYITTPHVTETFTYDRIKKLLIARQTGEATEHIEKVLSNLRGEYSYGGIFIHLLPKHKMPKTGKKPKHLNADPTQSIKSLRSNQKKTSEVLGAPILHETKKKFKGMLEKKEPQEKRKRPSKARPKAETNHRPRPKRKQTTSQVILTGLGKTIVHATKTAFNLAQRSLYTIGKITVGTIVLVTNKDNNRQAVIDAWKQGLKDQRESFGRLPLLSKILFIATVLFGITFLSSLGYLRHQENKQAATQYEKHLTEQILNKKDAAEASMIYDNSEKAMTLLAEAKILVEKLEEKNKEQQEKKELLGREINDALKKLQKMTTVSPALVANLTEANEQANATRLTHIADRLIAYGPDDTNLYQVDKDTKSIKTNEHQAIEHLANANAPEEAEEAVIFMTKAGDIATLDLPSLTLTAKDIAYPSQSSTIKDIAVYNDRIYSLDTAENQIYKHNSTQTGYDKGTAWIKTNTATLEDGRSITIDGNIYVLKANGTIVKFNKGNEQAFTISGLNPPLEQPTEMRTTSEGPHLYILEPTNKRVVVIDKNNGKLVAQYTTDTWLNPQSIAVDTERKTIYVLDEQNIYSFSI